MSGAIAGRARRLELARGIGRDGKRAVAPVGLVWSGVEVAIDPETLAAGELLITDYVIERFAAPDPAQAVTRDRVTRDAEDFGRVYAYDGREIGRVLRVGRGRSVVLEFGWPEGLPSSAPAKA